MSVVKHLIAHHELHGKHNYYTHLPLVGDRKGSEDAVSVYTKNDGNDVDNQYIENLLCLQLFSKYIEYINPFNPYNNLIK